MTVDLSAVRFDEGRGRHCPETERWMRNFPDEQKLLKKKARLLLR
jgi:hypothetical protein